MKSRSIKIILITLLRIFFFLINFETFLMGICVVSGDTAIVLLYINITGL